MPLTTEQTRQLEAAFKLEEHGFLQGNPYIKKSAIIHRLNLVDMAWSISEPAFVAHDGDAITYSGALVIGGISRHAIGTGLVISTKKNGDEVIALAGYDLARNIAKAHKTAASDLLPRAALQFGLGQYLKDKPKNVSESNFAEWLAKQPQIDKIHWALNGGRERVKALMDSLGLNWSSVSTEVQPGQTLDKLIDTTLTEVEFITRLVEMAQKFFQPATPKIETVKPEGSGHAAESPFR